MAKSKTRAAAKRVATASDEAASTLSAGWLDTALMHHSQIRSTFARALAAPAGGGRLTALKGLATLLNGHSLAEEIVLYPVLAISSADETDTLYTEQSHAKIEMAMLEQLDPGSDAWAAKLAEIRDAIEAHMLEEEQTLFAQIRLADVDQARLTARYHEEFDRYAHTGAPSTNAVWLPPPARLT